jgi:small multidrug resistance family-3 protein
VTVIKIAGIFAVAAVGEVAGAYAIWRWRRLGGSTWLLLVGALALVGYAVIQTFQPESGFGRLYAAYAGAFLLAAMTWGWLIDDVTPDRADLLGGAIVLVGAGVILFGR